MCQLWAAGTLYGRMGRGTFSTVSRCLAVCGQIAKGKTHAAPVTGKSHSENQHRASHAGRLPSHHLVPPPSSESHSSSFPKRRAPGSRLFGLELVRNRWLHLLGVSLESTTSSPLFWTALLDTEERVAARPLLVFSSLRDVLISQNKWCFSENPHLGKPTQSEAGVIHGAWWWCSLLGADQFSTHSYLGQA